MSQEERYGTRDMSYSVWHRRRSIWRFVGAECAQTLSLIDLDGSMWVEFDANTQEPLCLVETAMDIGQSHKNYKVTRNLAKLAGLPCFLVLYHLSTMTRNPADEGYWDIDQFRIKRLWPLPEDRQWIVMTPKEWAVLLVTVRRQEAAKLDARLRREQMTARQTPAVMQPSIPF